MNAFPVEMTWASMNVEPFRDVNNLKDHGYTALSGSWPREFSKDVEKPRPTSKDSQRRQSRRARARSSRKVAKPRGPRSRTPGPADAPPTPTDHRDVGAPSPTPSTDDSSIHTTSLRSFDLASIWSSESDSTLGAHEHEHEHEHEHFPYSPTSPLATSPISQNEADLDTAAHADGLASLADILAAFALDEQLISSPRDAFNDMCWASAVHEDGEEDVDEEALGATRRAKEIRARRRTMMYACRQWSEGVGGYDAIDEVDEDEPHSHYGDDPSPNYEEHQRDQRAGARAASGLLFDEDAQLHFALADPCFHTPSLPPIPSRSRPLPRPRPASRAPVSASANTLTFLTLASPTTTARPEDSVHFFPIPANRSSSPDAPASAGFGLGWKRIANRLVGGARSRSRRE